MLSQPRRMSTGTARSAHSVPEIATPVSQPGHWQSQHTYAHHVSSPHVDTPPAMGEVQAPQHEEFAGVLTLATRSNSSSTIKFPCQCRMRQSMRSSNQTCHIPAHMSWRATREPCLTRLRMLPWSPHSLCQCPDTERPLRILRLMPRNTNGT